MRGSISIVHMPVMAYLLARQARGQQVNFERQHRHRKLNMTARKLFSARAHGRVVRHNCNHELKR